MFGFHDEHVCYIVQSKGNQTVMPLLSQTKREEKILGFLLFYFRFMLVEPVVLRIVVALRLVVGAVLFGKTQWQAVARKSK